MRLKFKRLIKNSEKLFLLSKIKLNMIKNTDTEININDIKPKEPEDSIIFEYFQGIAYGNMYMRMYQATYSGSIIFKQTNTKRDKYGKPKGNPKTFYFVEGHNKEYSKLETLTKLIDKGILK